MSNRMQDQPQGFQSALFVRNMSGSLLKVISWVSLNDLEWREVKGCLLKDKSSGQAEFDIFWGFFKNFQCFSLFIVYLKFHFKPN